MDLAAADPAGADDKCPQCTRHHTEYRISVFVPDPAPATPEKVGGRAYVMCLCGRKYWYAAVHEVDARPVGSAEVRAVTSTKVQPQTGSLEIKGQEPVVTEKVTVTDEVAVVVRESEPLPPGGFIQNSPPHFWERWYKRNASLYFSARSDPGPALPPNTPERPPDPPQDERDRTK